MPGEAVIALDALVQRCGPGLLTTRELENDSDEAHQRQIQARPPYWRERLWTSQEPSESPRIWSGPARPAPQEQDQRLWHSAPRQAEAEGLLRRHHREAVQEELCGSHPHEG